MHDQTYEQPIRIIGAGPDEIVLTAHAPNCRPGQACWSEHAPGAVARRAVVEWIENGNRTHERHGTGKRLRLRHIVVERLGFAYLAYVDVVTTAGTV